MEDKKMLSDDELENVNGGVMDMRSNAMNLASGMIDQENQCKFFQGGTAQNIAQVAFGMNKQVNTVKFLNREN